MQKIYEYTKAPSGSIRPVCYLSPVIDSEGKIYSVFLLRRYVSGYGTYVYYPCVAFEANSFNGDWNNTPFSSTLTKIEGREIQYDGNTTNIYSDKQGYIDRGSSTFHDFNSEKKLAIKCISGFTNGSTSFSFFTPTDNQPNFEYKLYLPVIDYDSADFWEKIQHIPKPKLAFEIDTSTTGGGDGEYDDNLSDTIGLPDLTSLNANSINNTRFFTCYKLTPSELTKLSQELWSQNFIDIISNSVLKPTDFIVSLNMIPIDVPSTQKMMKAGQWLLNGAIGGVISGQFFRVDCGSIEIKKKWGGALDYLTKIALFLPFIGEVQLSPDDVMGSTISVIYTIDVMTGSCLASVKIVRDNLDAILYQYNGNCSATYPIVSQDYSALMSGVLQLGIHTIADYTKSLPQLKKNGSNKWVIDNTKISRKENLESGATSCLFDISPNVQRVGNMSSTVGFMGIKKPFIILSRPIQSLAENYNTYRGFVSNIAMTLGDCTGYTEVEEIHLENISATENEISEIENLLKTGVIF